MLKNEKQNRGTSREVKVEWGAGKTVDLSNGGFYHEVTNSVINLRP